jgi:hypothetical protein
MLRCQNNVLGRLLVYEWIVASVLWLMLVGANLHAFVTLLRLASTGFLGCRSLMPFVLDNVRMHERKW